MIRVIRPTGVDNSGGIPHNHYVTTYRVTNRRGRVVGFVRAQADGRVRAFDLKGKAIATFNKAVDAMTAVEMAAAR